MPVERCRWTMEFVWASSSHCAVVKRIEVNEIRTECVVEEAIHCMNWERSTKEIWAMNEILEERPFQSLLFLVERAVTWTSRNWWAVNIHGWRRWILLFIRMRQSTRWSQWVWHMAWRVQTRSRIRDRWWRTRQHMVMILSQNVLADRAWTCFDRWHGLPCRDHAVTATLMLDDSTERKIIIWQVFHSVNLLLFGELMINQNLKRGEWTFFMRDASIDLLDSKIILGSNLHRERLVRHHWSVEHQHQCGSNDGNQNGREIEYRCHRQSFFLRRESTMKASNDVSWEVRLRWLALTFERSFWSGILFTESRNNE